MRKTTQNERIIRHLNTYGSITPIEALSEYGIMRLASRISDLKKDYAISKRMVHTTNRYNEPVSYAEYYWTEDDYGNSERTAE